MTIVARNSLTISNINDGTITHYAYAYSADGTDRFTTVYPNLNLLDGTTKPFIMGYGIPNTSWDTTNKVSGISLPITVSANEVLPQGNNSFLYTYIPGATYTQSIYISTDAPLTGTPIKFTWFTGKYGHNTSGVDNLVKVSNNIYIATSTYTWPSSNSSEIGRNADISNLTQVFNFTKGTFLNFYKPKLEPGSVATPWMPSSSEVTTADWPSYIGQYSDFTATASTDPAKYAPWTVFKGKDGATGPQGPQGLKGDPGATGIPGQAGADGKTSYLHIAYATNSTGTAGFDVSNATGKTYIGQYTDFTIADSTDPSKYTWSLIKGDKGDKGDQGDQGPAGSNGDPGKVVSDTEPTTRFKGLTWKYSGATDLTASDGTVIKPNTEYYYNGTHWMINYLSANNLEANSITADLIDAKNLTITDGEFVSTIIDGPVQTQTEIKDDHLLIYKMDTSTNSINTIALKSDSGLAMTYQNSDTGEYTSAGVNFQGLFMQNNITNEFARLTPQGTKLSTDVPWTDITRASGVGTSGTLRARINNGVFYAQSKDVTIPSIAPNSLITIGTLSSKFSGVSGFDTLGLLYSPGQFSVASVSVGSDLKINIGNPNPTTMSGKVIQFSINIPLG